MLIKIPEKTHNALLKLNMTEKEIASYTSLLFSGAATVQEISRNTGINRVTIYSALDVLKQRGLVAETKKGKKNLFVAENPETLNKIIIEDKMKIDEKERLFQELILPTLKAIDAHQEKRPVIKFFEGLKGIYQVYDEYVLSGGDIISCGSYDSVMKVSSWEVELEYFTEIKKKNILFKAILEDSPTNRKIQSMSRSAMHIKFLPEGNKVSADILTFNDIVVLISYEKQVATVIEDQSIADSLKMYLNFMWDRL